MNIPFKGPYLDYKAPPIDTNKNEISIVYAQTQYGKKYLLFYGLDLIGDCSSLERAKNQRTSYVLADLQKNSKTLFIEEALDLPKWVQNSIISKRELKRLKNQVIIENGKLHKD